MIRSMTGFAARTGEGAGFSWAWEARCVNGKGLDLRLRLPDLIEGLEAAVRTEANARLARGNLSISLRLDRAPGAAAPALDPATLRQVLANLAAVQAEAARLGLALRDSSAAEILTMRGVTETAAAPDLDAAALKAGVMHDFNGLLDDLQAMRAAEGRALHDILVAQFARIEALTAEAGAEVAARAPVQSENFRATLARVLDNAEGADPARIAQELALLAVKTDVTEELDRLRAHVAAARTLLNAGEPVGRRLDFLAQEFNREANTLASKSNHAPLTRVALELKAAIDQMREQVQNVE